MSVQRQDLSSSNTAGVSEWVSVHPDGFKLSAELADCLGQTGYLASDCGMQDEAERIFDLLSVLLPQSPSPLIGLSVIASRRGDAQLAVERAQRAHQRFPDSDVCKAMLGLQLLQIGRGGALKLFEEVLATGKDSDARSLAASCVDVARRDEQPFGASSIEAMPMSTVEYFRHRNIRV